MLTPLPPIPRARPTQRPPLTPIQQSHSHGCFHYVPSTTQALHQCPFGKTGRVDVHRPPSSHPPPQHTSLRAPWVTVSPGRSPLRPHIHYAAPGGSPLRPNINAAAPTNLHTPKDMSPNDVDKGLVFTPKPISPSLPHPPLLLPPPLSQPHPLLETTSSFSALHHDTANLPPFSHLHLMPTQKTLIAQVTIWFHESKCPATSPASPHTTE